MRLCNQLLAYELDDGDDILGSLLEAQTNRPSMLTEGTLDGIFAARAPITTEPTEPLDSARFFQASEADALRIRRTADFLETLVKHEVDVDQTFIDMALAFEPSNLAARYETLLQNERINREQFSAIVWQHPLIGIMDEIGGEKYLWKIGDVLARNISETGERFIDPRKLAALKQSATPNEADMADESSNQAVFDDDFERFVTCDLLDTRTFAVLVDQVEVNTTGIMDVEQLRAILLEANDNGLMALFNFFDHPESTEIAKQNLIDFCQCKDVILTGGVYSELTHEQERFEEIYDQILFTDIVNCCKDYVALKKQGYDAFEQMNNAVQDAVTCIRSAKTDYQSSALSPLSQSPMSAEYPDNFV